MKHLFIFLLLSVGLFSCIEVEKPAPLPAYSVYSILNPSDSIISVFLAKTYSLNENFPLDSSKYIPDAEVIISNIDTQKKLTLNPKTKVYEARNNSFLKEGDQYKLEIRLASEEMISAKTTIPITPKLIIDDQSVNNQTGQIVVSWDRPRPDQNEFFRLLGTIDFQSSFTPFFYWDTELALWQTESRFEAGSKITSPLGNFDFSQNDSVEVKIILESLHEDWYDFNGKLNAFQTRTSFTKKFEAPVYFKSNLNNALGIFSSTTSTELTLKMYK